MARFRKKFGDAAAFDAIKPDPDKVGGVGEPPFVQLPDPASIFASRARRLAALAPGHPLGPYLLFLNDVVDSQHAAHTALPPLQPEQLTHRLQDGLAPLSAHLLQAGHSFADTLQWLLANVAVSYAPPEARDARHRLADMDAAARLALAAEVLNASYDPDTLAESLYVAAAVQLHFTRHAARLNTQSLGPLADNTCPACGGPPVASLIVGWAQVDKARYLACSVCSTLWNYVRIKCVSCGSTDGISYYAIDDLPQNVAAEACAKCRTYLKHMQQHEHPLLEPFADDIGSYSLGLLLREESFRNTGSNPLLIGG